VTMYTRRIRELLHTGREGEATALIDRIDRAPGLYGVDRGCVVRLCAEVEDWRRTQAALAGAARPVGAAHRWPESQFVSLDDGGGARAQAMVQDLIAAYEAGRVGWCRWLVRETDRNVGIHSWAQIDCIPGHDDRVVAAATVVATRLRSVLACLEGGGQL